MRTVHETEALRPSDPVPKNHNSYPLAVVNSALAAPTASLLSPSLHAAAAAPSFSQQQHQALQPARPQRLRLIMSAKRSADGHDPASAVTAAAAAYAAAAMAGGDKDNGAPPTLFTPELDTLAAAAAATERLQPSLSLAAPAAAAATSMMAPLLPLLPHAGLLHGGEEVYPDDVALTPNERALPPHQLFRLLRRQLHWAQDESRRLRGEVDALERRRRHEWMLKELLLENVMETELRDHDERQQRRQQRRRQRRLARQQQQQQQEQQKEALPLLPPPSPTVSEKAAANAVAGKGGVGGGAGTGAGAEAGTEAGAAEVKREAGDDDAAAVGAVGAAGAAGAPGDRPDAAMLDIEVGGDDQPSVNGTRSSARPREGAEAEAGGREGGGDGGTGAAAAEGGGGGGGETKAAVVPPMPVDLPEPRKPTLLPIHLPRTFVDGTVWAPYDDTTTAATAAVATSATATTATTTER